MDASGIRDWDEVKALVLESYGLIAPKKALAKLEGGRAKPGTAKEGTRKATARRRSRVWRSLDARSG
jgi:hypothetical protein